MNRIICVLALCLSTTACSKTEGTASAAAETKNLHGSCSNMKNLSLCTDYAGEAFALGENLVKGGCDATNGVWATTPCPNAKMVGTCSVQGGQTRHYYSDGAMAYKADDARKDCVDLFSGKVERAMKRVIGTTLGALVLICSSAQAAPKAECEKTADHGVELGKKEGLLKDIDPKAMRTELVDECVKKKFSDQVIQCQLAATSVKQFDQCAKGAKKK